MHAQQSKLEPSHILQLRRQETSFLAEETKQANKEAWPKNKVATTAMVEGTSCSVEEAWVTGGTSPKKL
jgi:hypothetical protein